MTADVISTTTSDGDGACVPATVLVAIVNYKTPGMVIACLESIARERTEGPAMEVIVTDNASGDGSVQQIAAAIERHGWQTWARVVALPKNGGFGYGNNAIIADGLARTHPPRYIWLLNSDTILRPGACCRLAAYLDAHGDVDMAGSRLEDPDGTPQISAFRFPTIASEFESAARSGPVTRLLRHAVVAPPVPDHVVRCDWVAGASLFIRTELLEKIGSFDEDYFLYFEESDLCLRAARAGAQCHYVPESRVIHLVGASTGVTDRQQQTKRRPAYWFRSRRHYFAKNHGRLYAVFADGAVIAGTLVWLARCAVTRRQPELPEAFLGDILRNAALINR